MTQITLKITGLNNVQRSTRVIGQAIPKLTQRSIVKALERARIRAAKYPPKRPGQRYKRTGRYGRDNQVIETEMGGRLEFNAPYTTYVGGNAEGQGQAWMHEGRWRVIADEVDAEAQNMVNEIEADLSDVIRQEGMGL